MTLLSGLEPWGSFSPHLVAFTTSKSARFGAASPTYLCERFRTSSPTVDAPGLILDFDAQNDSDLVIAETRVFWKPLYDPQVIPIKITPHIYYRFISETDSSVDFVGCTKDKDVAAADDFV